MGEFGVKIDLREKPYNMPPLGLFGKRCKIPTGMSGRQFVYRIIKSGVRSNAWSEIPLTYQTESRPTRHDETEEIIFVVLDTLIDDKSRILRVALKDVELMEDEDGH